MADTFNRMAGALQEQHDQLERQAFTDSLTGHRESRAVRGPGASRAGPERRYERADRRADDRPRRLQARQRRARAFERRRADRAGRRADQRRRRVRRTRSPGWAATSSPCCSRASAASTTRWARPSASATCSTRRSSWTARTSWSARASASRWRVIRSTPRSCCGARTSPCTASRSTARTAPTFFDPAMEDRAFDRLDDPQRPTQGRRAQRAGGPLSADRRPRDR